MELDQASVLRQLVVIFDRYGLNPQGGDATLSEMGADSLDLAELLLELEDYYRITFDREDMIIRFETTVGDLAAAVVSCMRKQTSDSDEIL